MNAIIKGFSIALTCFTVIGFQSQCFASNLEAQAAASDMQMQVTEQTEEDIPRVSCQMDIDAKPEKVWAAIQARRNADPHSRRLLSYDGKVAMVKELFPSMPVLGKAFCTYSENEVSPNKLIEYKLVDSDHFRKFQGAWRLSPGARPNTTTVSLSNTFDPGVRFPFWNKIAIASMKKDVARNLNEVSRMAVANTAVGARN